MVAAPAPWEPRAVVKTVVSDDCRTHSFIDVLSRVPCNAALRPHDYRVVMGKDIISLGAFFNDNVRSCNQVLMVVLHVIIPCSY